MSDLTPYIKHFTSLNRAPGPTWTEATKRKAPHKPLLLLALLDLVHRGVITCKAGRRAVMGHAERGGETLQKSCFSVELALRAELPRFLYVQKDNRIEDRT